MSSSFLLFGHVCELCRRKGGIDYVYFGHDGAAEGLKYVTAQHSVGLLKTILLQSIPDSIRLAALNAIYFPYKLLKGPSSNPFWAATESPKITKLHSETKQNHHEPSSKKMIGKFKNCAASSSTCRAQHPSTKPHASTELLQEACPCCGCKQTTYVVITHHPPPRPTLPPRPQNTKRPKVATLPRPQSRNLPIAYIASCSKCIVISSVPVGDVRGSYLDCESYRSHHYKRTQVDMQLQIWRRLEEKAALILNKIA